MSVLKVKDNGVWKDVPSIKGETGDAAGFGTATASVDTGTGTPSCVVTLSGDDTAKNFDFAFHNLMYDDSDLQSDFADLADDFDVLQRQFDTAVAALTVDSEVADIRVGDDGVTYTSAGAAVRGQFHDVKSALTNTEDGVFTFSEKSTVLPPSDGWRLNESDGLCAINVNYQLKKFAVNEGDVISVISDDRFQFQNDLSVPSTGQNNRVGVTYPAGTYLLKVPNGATCIIVSTPKTDSIAKVYASSLRVNEIDDVKTALDCEIAPIVPTDFYTMPNVGKGLNYRGELTTDSSQDASDYIDIQSLYDICRVVQTKEKFGLGTICYYTEAKQFIRRDLPGTNYDFSIYNGETVVWFNIDKTIANAKYVRFSGDNSRGFKYWVVNYGLKATKLDQYAKWTLFGKTVVNFGDSIFGQTRPPKDVSSYLAEKTGATVYNCGFGGCEMSVHADSNYDAFSMYRLADAVATNTWTLQETAAAASGMPTYFAETVALLKTIDFSKVDIVTIGYGTNDWNNGTELDNGGNSNKAYFADALRYSIETLLTAFPNLKIFVCTQTYRFFMDGSYNFVDDSNTHTNSHGKTLIDFVNKTIEVAKEYNLPYIDNYSIGMGKYSRSYYFYTNDGTHPKPEGNMLIAANMANKLF